MYKLPWSARSLYQSHHYPVCNIYHNNSYGVRALEYNRLWFFYSGNGKDLFLYAYCDGCT